MPSQRTHKPAVVPGQMSFEFSVQFLYAGEFLPVVEIALVTPVAALHFSVVPGCSGRNELVGDLLLGQSCLKWAQRFIADKTIGELGAVVGLYRLDWEWEGPEQPFQEVHGVLRCVFLIAVHKPETSTFINGGPLVPILFNSPSQTVIRDLFYIDLHLFSWFCQLRIPPSLPGRPFSLLSPAKLHPGRRMIHPPITPGISMLLFQFHIHAIPTVAHIFFVECLSDRCLLLRGMLLRMTMGPVRPFLQ